LPPGNGTNVKPVKNVTKPEDFLISEEEELNILEAAADASIQIGDGDILTPEEPDTAGTRAMEPDLTLIAPAPYGGGVDAKDTGDLSGSQGGFHGLAGETREPGGKDVHQTSPATFSGTRECPNQ